MLWPKERKLLEILAEEKSQGRQVWVFCTYTSTHPVLGRLEKIIQEAGYTVRVLDADKVPTRRRSTWIARNAPGVDVIISHPQPVCRRRGWHIRGRPRPRRPEDVRLPAATGR